MLPSQWPGLGPAVDFSSLDNAGGSRSGFLTPFDPNAAAGAPDGVVRPWWTCGTGASNGTGYGTPPGSGTGDPFASSGSGSLNGKP